MNRKNKTDGLTLDRPSVAAPKISPWFSFGFNTGVLVLAVAASLGCVITAFNLSVNLPPLIITALVCAVVCSAQAAMGKLKLPVMIGQLLAWGVVLRFNFTAIKRACLRFANAVIAAYNSEYALNITELPLNYTSPTRAARQNTLLAALAIWLLCQILYLLIISHKKPFAAFCVTGVFVLVPLGASVTPGLHTLGAMLTLWLFLLFVAPALRHGRGFAFSAELTEFRPNSLLLIATLAVCVLAFYFAFPESEYTRPESVQSVKESLVKGELPVDVHFGTDTTLDLTELSPRSFTGETALRVRRTPTEQYTPNRTAENTTEYLKSYVGSVYTGTGWQSLDKTTDEKIAAALGEFSAQTLPASLAEQYPDERDVHSLYTLEIETVNADEHSMYVPCGLSGEVDGAKFVGDGYLSPSSVFGVDSYTLTETGLPYVGVPMADRFKRLFTGEVENRDNADGLIEKLNNEDDVFNAFSLERMSRYVGAELIKIPEWAKNELPDVDFSLMNAVEQYTEIVYDEYTKLPDETYNFIESFLTENGYLEYHDAYIVEYWDYYSYPQEMKDEIPWLVYDIYSAYPSTSSYNDVYKIIRMILNDTCDYTLSPQAAPDDADFVEYFLSESHEGYCVHFATAAAAILRYLGIPARYAEGYSVNIENDGEWTTVHDYNAHAWVEVYHSGTGWLPVEFTPSSARNSYAEEIAATPTPAPTAEPAASPTPTPTPTPTVEQTQAPTPAPTKKPAAENDFAADTTDSEKPTAISVLAVIIILAVGVAYAQRRARIYLRQKSFTSPDTNRAALCAYGYLLQLHREAARSGIAESEPPPQLEQLALKARFSGREITTAELFQIVTAADALAAKMKAELPLAEELKCEYVLALI